MKAGHLLLFAGDVIILLHAGGYITPEGEFNEQKFNDLNADFKLIADIEAALLKYGVDIPDKVEKIIQILPLLISIVR